MSRQQSDENVLLQICFFLATAVTLASIWLQAKTFVEQLRRRRTEDELEEDSYRLKHSDRLNETIIALRLIYASLMVGLAEVCKNMVVLQSL